MKLTREHDPDARFRKAAGPYGASAPARRIIIAALVSGVMVGCADTRGDTGELESLILRYNDRLSRGYRTQNMNSMRDVTTEEQALKLYHHMSALGEGGLRMESRLKKISFTRINRRSSREAAVETEETWDFIHRRMNTNERYAEEKDFVYRMGYLLSKANGRWIISRVTTISGVSTNNVVPWPVVDRNGATLSPAQKIRKPVGQF